MNIFYLDSSPNICAAYHCDKHVVKMVLESAQMLSTAHHIMLPDADNKKLYKPLNKNHPCNKWIRSARSHYRFVYKLYTELLYQYTLRYSKIHRSNRLSTLLAFCPATIPQRDFTPPPLCMPDDYKTDDPVRSYQLYYIGDKHSFATWRNGTPDWWPLKERDSDYGQGLVRELQRG